MNINDQRRIEDILNLAQEVAQFRSINFEVFADDLIVVRATERAIELIGESATKISKVTRESIPQVAWQDLADMRILLAHNYQRVNIQVLWKVATEDVPGLARVLQAHLDHL